MFTWLIVEDEPDLYDTLLVLFEISSVHGITFTTGADAVRWIESLDHDGAAVALPQLALLDIHSSEVSGPVIGHWLRQSPILNNIAVVLMSDSRFTPKEEEEIIACAQADALIYKPLPNPDDFCALLENILADRYMMSLRPAKIHMPHPCRGKSE